MEVDSRLDLNGVIRPTLVRLEDSIILSLFERSQHKLNSAAYMPGQIKIPGFDGSFFNFLLEGTEKIHAQAGRYAHPQEYPFSKNTPKPIAEKETTGIPIVETGINANDKIFNLYFNSLKRICEEGDDLHYGSSVVADINALQHLSRRIHFGMYVAESKYQSDPQGYDKLIENKDTDGIMEKLTNLEVERRIMKNVSDKGERYNVDPEFVSEFFIDKIIPLTKEIEVDYFYRRNK